MATIDQTKELSLEKTNKEINLNWNLGGVYSITNIKNNNVYFGKTCSLRKRIREHRYMLLKNIHYNKHLQASFNKHSIESFVFKIILTTNNKHKQSLKEEKLIESYLKDPYKREKCYNVLTKSYETAKGNKIAKKLGVHFILVSPQDELVVGFNINEFCRKNNLSSSGVSQLINGKIDSYKGWIRPTENRSKIKQKASIKRSHRAKTYQLINPSGKKIKITNLSKFCNEQNLNKSMMFLLANKRLQQYKGWTNIGHDREKILNKLNKFRGPKRKEYEFINPMGRLVTVNNLKNFCQENNLNYTVMCKVGNKKRRSHKGWKSA